ncbi:Homeodomain-like protein [Geopyxis carbonaria]|nr:Homeodomain-like protein [Geopyxis carbonaria]
MTDEPLLPVDGGSISLETPLFNVKEKDEPFIQKAVLAEARKSQSVARPSAEEYNVFVSTAWRLCQSNPREWLRNEMRYTSTMYRNTSGGIQKPSHGKRQLAASPRRALPAGTHRPQPTSRPARAPRATPKMAAHHHFENGMPTPSSYHGSPTPAPRQRLTAPTREDSNFEALPDLTPPLESLPNNNRCLMTDWRGTPLPIENEPHFEKLHQAEVKLASTLRLTPAIYLSSKRRMFIGKVQRTQIGKEFRKTDAQKACKIDVNKASKLWTAFDKVGWLNKQFVEPHLHKEINIEQ